ncbi:MAG TPA: ArsA family ATPase [Ilumatobacteraceae bacterium]|nr:ArsA family ATPase [Ilumatobacteraceae bacterium]
MVTAASASEADAAAPPILDRRLAFVTGKGGVGKTSIASALALLAAREGRRVLVCEMDAKGSLATAFDAAPLTFQPREIEPGLFAMAMNTEDALREYLRLFVKVPLLGKIGPLARTFDFVADAAPGVKEILAVGKLCHEVRERHYDLVVVDAEATGHIVAQVGAPKVIRDLVKVGLVRDQTEWMLELLQDPAVTGVAIVTTPEEMPVTETLSLLARLGPETGVEPSLLVANRVLPARFDAEQAAVFAELDRAHAVLTEAAGRGVTAVLTAARIIEARRQNGEHHLEHLREEAPELPMVIVPELFTRATGRRVVELVADSLAADPRLSEGR